MKAVPALVNCAVPSRWMSEQYAAEASQKFTCPTVSVAVPAVTVAVSVTTLPEATVVTGMPPEVIAKVVVIEELPAILLWTLRR